MDSCLKSMEGRRLAVMGDKKVIGMTKSRILPGFCAGFGKILNCPG